MNITADRTDSIEMSSNILTPEQFVEIVIMMNQSKKRSLNTRGNSMN